MPLDPGRKSDLPTLEALLAAIVESSDDAIISKDLDGIVTSWNPAAERVFGYPAAEMIGAPIRRLIPGDRQDEEATFLARLREGERVEHYETVRLRKDGRQIYVSLTISPVRNRDGEIVGASKIARDITLQRQMALQLQERADQIQLQNEELELQNEELTAQNLELEAADRHKNQFLAMLAHELRNPLAPILNAMRLLQIRGSDDPEVRKQYDRISRQLRQMTRLLDDLLEVSRVTRGIVSLRLETLDLADAVHNTVQVMEDYIAERGHELVLDLPFTPVLVEGDLTRLQQVISNLLSNAVKFMDRGGKIYVSLRQGKEQAELRIRDTGPGIAPELLPRIFELFTQADQGLARRKGGLGVGLTIVHNLVELHRGTVEARSEGPGKGSEFIVCLPLAKSAAARTPATDSAAEQEPVDRPADRGVTAVSAPRVLVVEDNQDAADSLAELLRYWGYEVRIARDGIAALEVAREFCPRVILLDLGLPGMDGYEVASLIRRRQRAGSPQVLVATTGYGQETDRQRTRAAGFAHHLTKPVDPDGLLLLLRQIIR
jgi:two-component system CheB/CheR fusion protein